MALPAAAAIKVDEGLMTPAGFGKRTPAMLHSHA
jgi:hypothetical protein